MRYLYTGLALINWQFISAFLFFKLVLHCVVCSNAFYLCASVGYFKSLSAQLVNWFCVANFFSMHTSAAATWLAETRWCCHFASVKFISWLNTKCARMCKLKMIRFSIVICVDRQEQIVHSKWWLMLAFERCEMNWPKFKEKKPRTLSIGNEITQSDCSALNTHICVVSSLRFNVFQFRETTRRIATIKAYGLACREL